MKKITYNKKGQITYTQSELIEELIDNDMDTIKSELDEVSSSDGECEYLYNILLHGFCGYNKFTNKELIKESMDRFDVRDEIIIIKEKKK